MEVTLELAEAYLLDRVQELMNYDVKAGTPFVFLSAFTLLKTLTSDTRVPLVDLLPEGYMDGNQYFKCPVNALEEVLTPALTGLSLQNSSSTVYGKINLSHETVGHLGFNSEKNTFTLCAEPFLVDVKSAIVKFFELCREDKVLAAKAYVLFNTKKFIGYGGDD